MNKNLLLLLLIGFLPSSHADLQSCKLKNMRGIEFNSEFASKACKDLPLESEAQPQSPKATYKSNLNVLEYELRGDEVAITGCASCTRIISIPAQIGEHKAKTIAAGAFLGAPIKVLIIEDGVEVIEALAFSGGNLDLLRIPDSITTIENAAFADNKIRDLLLGNGLTAIGSLAFSRNQLKKVDLPTSVATIGFAAFAGNPIAGVFIPKTVITIGNKSYKKMPPTAFDPNALRISDVQSVDRLEDSAACNSYIFAKQEWKHAQAVSELSRRSITHEECLFLLEDVYTLEITKAKSELKNKNLAALDRDTKKLRKKMWKWHKNKYVRLKKALERVKKTGELPERFF